MIDLERTKVIVSTWPHYGIDLRMSSYLVGKGLPNYNITAAQVRGNVIERRNRIVKNLVLPKLPRYDWFLFIDHDHYPEGGLLEPFFDDVPEDVVGCQYETGCNNSWNTPDVFHMGMVRIRGQALAKVDPPWFLFTYNEDGTKIEACECEYLRTKLLQAGCTITTRGRVGHDSEHVWYH